MHVNHRIPVLAGVFDTSFENTQDISEYSKFCGADAIVITPPYYFPLDQYEIIKYTGVLSRASELPFVYYNIPSHTKLHSTLDTIREINEMGAIGIKDSSDDLSFLYSLIEEFKDSPDFSVLTGTELHLPETILKGGHGAVAGGANIFPSLFVKLYDACINKNTEQIAFLREHVLRLNNSIYTVGKHPARISSAIKCALSLMGICDDYMAPPLNSLNNEERKQVKKYLATFSNIKL